MDKTSDSSLRPYRELSPVRESSLTLPYPVTYITHTESVHIHPNDRLWSSSSFWLTTSRTLEMSWLKQAKKVTFGLLTFGCRQRSREGDFWLPPKGGGWLPGKPKLIKTVIRQNFQSHPRGLEVGSINQSWLCNEASVKTQKDHACPFPGSFCVGKPEYLACHTGLLCPGSHPTHLFI